MFDNFSLSIDPMFLIAILLSIYFWIMFKDIIEAKADELRERARKLKRENDCAENPAAKQETD